MDKLGDGTKVHDFTLCFSVCLNISIIKYFLERAPFTLSGPGELQDVLSGKKEDE